MGFETAKGKLVMHKRLFIYAGIGLLALFFHGAYLQLRANHRQAAENATATSDAEHLYMIYTTWDGHIVTMVNDANRLGIRVILGDSLRSDEALVMLKAEVGHLSTGETVPLGKTGCTFHMSKGKPIWEPYLGGLGNQVRFQCLYFATDATVNDKGLIEAVGITNP